MELAVTGDSDDSQASDLLGEATNRIILGVDTSGGLHTLLGCFQTRHEFGSGWPATQARWYAAVHLVGVHVSSADEPVGSMRVDIASLLPWSGLQPIKRAAHDGGFGLAAARVSGGVTVVDGHEVELCADCVSTVNGGSVTVDPQAHFEIRFNGPVTIADAIARFADPLDQLIMLLTGHAAKLEPIRWTFADPDPRGEPRTAVHHESRVDDDVPVRPVSRTEMLAAWPIPTLTFDGLMSGWFQLIDRLGYAVTMVNVPHAAPGQFGETLALTAFLAIEHIHNLIFDSHADDPAAHKARTESILATAPAEHQEWLTARLGGNQKSFRRRLEEVIAYAGSTGRNVTDVYPGYVRSAVSVRNTVAHPSKFGPDDGERYLYIGGATRWIVRHCLLLQLGLAEETVAALVRRCGNFRTDMQLLERMNRIG